MDKEFKSQILRLNISKFGVIENNQYTKKIPISCDLNQSIIAVGGFQDGSLKLIKGQSVIQTIKFHKKSITKVIVKENSNKIICGSKDCRITVWKLHQLNQRKNILVEKSP